MGGPLKMYREMPDLPNSLRVALLFSLFKDGPLGIIKAGLSLYRNARDGDQFILQSVICEGANGTPRQL